MRHDAAHRPSVKDGARHAAAQPLVLPREGEPTGIDMRVGFSSTDIEADHADLLARGVDVDEQIMRMGDPVPPILFFRDQDGNRAMIVERS